MTSINRVAYICGGCGKRLEATSAKELGPLPDGWLSTDHERQTEIMTVCSADCVPAARENAKAYWRKWVEEKCKRIDEHAFRRGDRNS